MEDDRKAHWQGVYQQKSTEEVSWFQAEPALSLALIQNCHLTAADPIIDVGGGASVLMDHMLAQGYTELSVLDISAAALAAAKRRLGAAARRVTWIESDITRYQPADQFALWHDRAVFHFLTDAADRRAYVATLKRALRPGGFVVMAAFAIGGPEKCSGLPIVQYDAGKLLNELGEGFRLLDECSEVHTTPSGGSQAFAWFRLIYRA